MTERCFVPLAENTITVVYLAGAITGVPDYKERFAAAAADLRNAGYGVIDPCEIDSPEEAAEALSDPYGERYQELLARDLDIINSPDVEAVVVLPGWEKSRGAWREVDEAVSLDKPVLEYPNLNPAPVYEERCRLRENGYKPWDRVTRVPIRDTPKDNAPKDNAITFGKDDAIQRIRTFDTGATRDTDEGKPDYEGYLSPRVIRAYGAYMLKHSLQNDGSRRASDNWQKGIPLDAYMKSAWRHFMDWWEEHREGVPGAVTEEALTEALCALIFNAHGYLHELLDDS